MNLKPERKGEIIQASLRLIEKRGIQNLTTKNIAKEVGITEPGIYRHFKKKQDILAAILAMFRSAVQKSFDSVKDTEDPPLDTIGDMYADSLRRFQKNPAITAVIFSEEIFQNNTALSREVYSIMETTRDGIQRLLRGCRKRGEIQVDVPDKQLSLIIIGAFRLLVTRWRLSGRSFDLVEEGGVLWGSLKSLINNKEGRHETDRHTKRGARAHIDNA
jgi:TetR/AcrR family fatty acid metabolism transcriptional regulator